MERKSNGLYLVILDLSTAHLTQFTMIFLVIFEKYGGITSIAIQFLKSYFSD